LTTDHGKGGTQHFMPSHDFVDAPLQHRRVEYRRQSKRAEEIEKRYAGQRLL
jgi:hypothetical protein